MAVINKSTLFPAQLENELFNAVKGHSSLAMLSNQEAVPFTGKDIFTFNFSNDISVVGESAEKPAGDGAITPVQIRPIKVVYQMRVSDEYMYAEEEAKINTLSAFADGFARKLGSGLDKMAMHGVDPKTGSASSIIGTNHFDAKVTNKVIYSAATADENIDAAVALVEGGEYTVNGIAMSPAMRGALAGIKSADGNRLYPEFAFGATPEKLGAMNLDSNATVSAGGVDHAIVGDFANAFRWGIAKEIPVKVIEYGDPDGQGDLQQLNQVLLRAEAYIGWGIMDPAAFARVATA